MTDPCALEPMLSIEAAAARIAAAVTPVGGVEKRALKQALGRILAEPVYAPFAMPQDRNAAVDGYAFHSASASGSPFRLRLAGAAWAGQPFTGRLQPGQCIRIFTGAVVPDEADSVVMQELVAAEGDDVLFPAEVRTRRFVREAGEDVGQGDLLCAAGKKLTAYDIGLLASAGLYDVTVKRPLKIAYLSTGDELAGIGNPLTAGKIYDSNRYMLGGLLTDPCYCAADLGSVADDRQALRAALAAAARDYDAILTTGGASVGEADFIASILAEIGTVDFWKVAMKPGKPLAFGKIGQALFFGLPGNPVAVAVTFRQIVEPALERLAGGVSSQALRIRATCTAALKKDAGRLEFQRGLLTQDPEGGFWVAPRKGQGSHLLAALAVSNCYIVLPAECEQVAAGETVWVEPFQSAL